MNYTKLLIEKLKESNETRLANSFLKLLSNNASSLSQMTMNESMKVPIDHESLYLWQIYSNLFKLQM